MPKSIAARMALTWSLLLLLVTALGVASSVLGVKKLVQQEHDRAGQELANLAALAAAEYLSAGKPEALTHLAESVRLGDLSVTDVSGRVIAGSNQDRGPSGGGFKAAILSPEGQTLGCVHLWLTEPPEYASAAALRWAVGAAPVLLMGLLLAAQFARRTLQKPLTELAEACEQLGTGDFTSRVAVKRSDELGAFARSLNAMCSHLMNLLASIKAVATELQGGMERLAERLEGTARVGERLFSTLLQAKRILEEGVTALGRSRERAEELGSSLEATQETVRRGAELTGSALKLMEEDARAVVEAVSRLQGCRQLMAETREQQGGFLAKGQSWSTTVERLAVLVEPLPSFVVDVALMAVRTGRQELTQAAEELNRTLREMHAALKALSRELAEVLETGRATEQALENSLEELGSLETYLTEARSPWLELRQTLREKQELDDALQEQNRRLAEILAGLSRELEETLETFSRLLAESMGEGSLEPVNWEEIKTAMRGLSRSTQRLYSLALQYKT